MRSGRKMPDKLSASGEVEDSTPLFFPKTGGERHHFNYNRVELCTTPPRASLGLLKREHRVAL
jgi:hypothetical protein